MASSGAPGLGPARPGTTDRKELWYADMQMTNVNFWITLALTFATEFKNQDVSMNLTNFFSLRKN